VGGIFGRRLSGYRGFSASLLRQYRFYCVAAALAPAPVFSFAFEKRPSRPAAYFFSIGMAYMLIEIVLMQRFILFLDHPLYAASAVIGSLLVSSACGSYASTKLELKAAWKISRHLLWLVLALALYALFLPRVLAAGIGHPLITRAVIAIVLNSVLGFLMGFPFPVGIRKLGQSFANLIPWAYGANSAAAVISSAFAVLVALEFGFTWVMVIAIGFYLVAAASSWRWHLS
jgi:hypothetical protein